MSARQADIYMEQASELYLEGNLVDALRYARAAIAQLGVTTMAMTGGSQVQAQQHRSHQQILDFIAAVEADMKNLSGSRRLRVQTVEYRNPGGPSEC